MSVLSHLSELEINELIEEYYKGKKIDELIREYKIEISNVSSLVKNFPPLICSEILCRHCGINMLKPRHSRSGSPGTRHYCGQCGCNYVNHREMITRCGCPKCSKIYEEICEKIKNEKSKVFKDFLESQLCQKTIAEDDFDLVDGIYLMVSARALADEGMEYLSPLAKGVISVAPTRELSRGVIEYLWKRGIIYIHQHSPLEAFVFNAEGDQIISFNPEMCYYGFNLGGVCDTVMESYIKIESRTIYLMNEVRLASNREDLLKVRNLMHDLAFHECIEYLLHIANQHGFDYRVGEKTTIVFKRLLNDFSVSQIYGIIWNAVKNATAFHARNKCPKRHAMNTISGSCLSYADKALSNNWIMKGYNRDFNCPRSALSLVLYEQLLRKSDSGFTESFSKIEFSDLEELQILTES